MNLLVVLHPYALHFSITTVTRNTIILEEKIYYIIHCLCHLQYCSNTSTKAKRHCFPVNCKLFLPKIIVPSPCSKISFCSILVTRDMALAFTTMWGIEVGQCSESGVTTQEVVLILAVTNVSSLIPMWLTHSIPICLASGLQVCTHHFHQNSFFDVQHYHSAQCIGIFYPGTFYDRDVLSVRIESNQCAV